MVEPKHRRALSQLVPSDLVDVAEAGDRQWDAISAAPKKLDLAEEIPIYAGKRWLCDGFTTSSGACSFTVVSPGRPP
jgi:hypothetical protein